VVNNFSKRARTARCTPAMGVRGQVTIFIIIAIVIVGGVIVYFSLRSDRVESLSVEMRPVYDYYLSCIESHTRDGISLLGEQGGYIELPAFEPGSAYRPFSSQLNFLGQPVPYWMYVSGNNLLREQVPTKSGMEEQLAEYVRERVGDCDFSDFEQAGYDVYVDEGLVDIDVNEYDVAVGVGSRLTIYLGNQSAVVSDHELSVDSKLGRFYDLAKDVYDYEKVEMFLEKYALDVMRLYAPVTGTEIGCAPKIFVDEEIRSDIIEGLIANIPSVKLEGSYYDLTSQERGYFVEDVGVNVDENVNFLYSPAWPTKIEIYGDRVVKPIGMQEGLSVLGFCYVPYQLIYDINFPVMVQFYDNDEIFQFPVAIMIEKNQAREAVPSVSGASIESPVCDYKNQPVTIRTYDSNLNPVEARISFKCLNSVCNIGETVVAGGDAVLSSGLPQCVNGFIQASADGFADRKYQISTNEEGVANIVLSRKYRVPLDLGGVSKALVTFTSDEYSATVMYPETSELELIEGSYNISVYAYADTPLKFPAINDRVCTDVPESGFSGILGSEVEKCFEINIPESEVAMAVVGGGRTVEYITEDQMARSNELNINVPLFGVPSNLEELQANQISADDETIYLEFE